MKITFTLRGKPIHVSGLDNVIALQPSEAVRATRSAAKVMTRFLTARADDDTSGGRFGNELPSKNRKIFEHAGWMFVDAHEHLTEAAQTRSTLADADAVRPVLVSESGETMIGTDLVTVQTPAKLTDAQALAEIKAAGLRLVRRLTFGKNLFEARLPAKVPFAEAIANVQAYKGFIFAEPSLIQSIGGRFTPTDPSFSSQWQHRNTGASGGVAGADIKSELAWNRTLGTGIKIAVIDNGMQVKHPDLKSGLFSGGHFESDGVGGATFIKRGAGTFPDGDHGTFCMGMAGARHNNKKGGCGSAPESKLIPVACLTDQVGTQATLARALAYAANPTTEDPAAQASDGADVIACSLGPNGADWDLTSVLDLAIQGAATNGRGGKGTPIFWAVSNGPVEVKFDEVSSHPDVMGVGRSNRNDLEDGSAFGPKLEFLAPGVDVFSTKTKSKYGLWTGTSFACPLTAGVAALVLARFPTMTRDQLRAKLRKTCDKIGGVTYNSSGHHDEYGYGRINADAATT